MGGGGIGGMRSGLGVNSGMGGIGGMGNTGLNQMGTTTPGGIGAAGGANASFTDRIRGIIGRAGSSGSGAGAGDIQVIGQTKIISDERTNSLLIYATRDDMKTIRKIIEQLDVVLAQVLIEAVIHRGHAGRHQELRRQLCGKTSAQHRELFQRQRHDQ